jgi:acetyl esterase/lipase
MIGLSAGAATLQAKVETIYATVTNLSYRSVESTAADPYMQERCRLDVYYPQNTTNFATLVWFHGGGLQGGSKSILPALKEKGIAVVAANYRLFPKARCPDYLDDAAAALAWTFTNIAAYGGSPSLIFVSGHSAGGYLTSMLGLDTHWLAKYGVDANAIAGLIPLSGQTITHLAIRKERGIGDKQAVVDEFAPLFHARRDAPPLLLITGDRSMEMLGRYEENAYLMRMMLVNGHTNTTLFEIQGYPHNMIEPACPLLLKFIRQHTPAPAAPAK